MPSNGAQPRSVGDLNPLSPADIYPGRAVCLMAAIFARVAGNSRRRRRNFVAVSQFLRWFTACRRAAAPTPPRRASESAVEAALLAIVLLLGYFPTAPVVDFPTNVLPQHYVVSTCTF